MALKGKTAVVTGGGSGIGRAISLRLAKDGAAVAVWDLNGDSAHETASMAEKAGGRAIGYACDAAAKDSIATALSATRDDLGQVTILVNNAGVTGMTPFLEMQEDVWDRVLRVNLKGPFLCTQAILPDMIAARWGRIVNITSSSALSGPPQMAHYVASKAGLMGLTRSLAIEFAATGITVNNIPPGYIDTPMLRATARNMEGSVGSSPMKRAGAPEDIAAACAYLVSEDANYVTGQTLNVNGGRVLS